jgi:hypothetical protein
MDLNTKFHLDLEKTVPVDSASKRRCLQNPTTPSPTMKLILQLSMGKKSPAPAESGTDDESDDNTNTKLRQLIRSEIERYFLCVKKTKTPLNCLAWWRANAVTFPFLAPVAQVMLAQPAGTPDTERKASGVEIF